VIKKELTHFNTIKEKGGSPMSVSLAALAAAAIKLIILGVEATKAVEQISSQHNTSFDAIWRELPDIFK
jgi:hypothetical protein